MTTSPPKHFLLASDFDQTLSFNDSGFVLSELLGVEGFQDRSRDSRAAIWSSRAASSRISFVTIRSFVACGASISSKPAGEYG